MSSTPINNHVEQALARLLEQYKGKARIEALLTALVTPIQELEDTFNDLNTLRAIAVAVGQQLDNLGKIIGLARIPGDSDDVYRNKLYAEVKVNTSNGQPEQVIQTYQLFTAAQLVLLFEFFPAEVLLESDYMPPDQATVDLLISIINKVLPAGVRPYGIVAFDPTDAFAYAGSLAGVGYGDATDPMVGGLYPYLFTHNGFFEYDGDDASGLGYGSSADPLVGGEYAT